jgi:hypothetical protein
MSMVSKNCSVNSSVKSSGRVFYSLSIMKAFLNSSLQRVPVPLTSSFWNIFSRVRLMNQYTLTCFILMISSSGIRRASKYRKSFLYLRIEKSFEKRVTFRP